MRRLVCTFVVRKQQSQVSLVNTPLSIVEWSNKTDGYSVSNENKTATRISGLTKVLYSSSQSYTAGHPISFRVMGTGEKSPMDGLAITLDNDDTDTLKREGVIFVATDGM